MANGVAIIVHAWLLRKHAFYYANIFMQNGTKTGLSRTLGIVLPAAAGLRHAFVVPVLVVGAAHRRHSYRRLPRTGSRDEVVVEGVAAEGEVATSFYAPEQRPRCQQYV